MPSKTTYSTIRCFYLHYLQHFCSFIHTFCFLHLCDFTIKQYSFYSFTLETLIIGKNRSINKAIGGLLNSNDRQNLHYIHLGESLKKTDIENISSAKIIITDLTYTNNNSKLFVQQLRQLNPDAIILALHIYHEPEFIQPIIEAGASAYLLLNTSSQEIETALEFARNGKVFITMAPKE